jgi:Cu2+-exporting ATPase
MLFDKTGTLTADRLEVVAVAPADGPGAAATTEQATAWHDMAASLAAWSTHPASRAIAASQPHPRVHAWTDVVEEAGQGLAARLAGRCVRLGRAGWVDAAITDAPAAVWLGIDGRAVLRFELREALRDQAREAIERLRDLGIATGLLSGDTPARVAAVAATLGIADWHAQATPDSKLAQLALAQERGELVAMVGDGINDAPVLARADASIAFAHGAALNRLHADAILLGESLQPLADAVVHARRTLRVIRQNLAWAALYNAACIPLALAGWLPPWAAGLGMAASSLLVVGNALRLARVEGRR